MAVLPRTARWAAAAGVGSALMLTARPADAAESMPVPCAGVLCGTMNIQRYETLAAENGVEIRGRFTAAASGNYHYLQAIVGDNLDSSRWWHDATVPLPLPYLDTPPGGYLGQLGIGGGYSVLDPYDHAPWYDEAGEFPGFFDRPTTNPRRAMFLPQNTIHLQFETWLVCEISNVQGPLPNRASDDFYVAAPLIGFGWGFEIRYLAATDAFAFQQLPFNWLAAPTPAWLTALTAVYGTGASADNFNITLRDCSECRLAPVPEPGSAMLMLAGLLVLMLLMVLTGHRCRAGGG